jgi:protease I
LESAGATTVVVSLVSGEIRGWKDKDWHHTTKVDTTVAETSASDYDALLLPGGVINPDLLRRDEKAVAFVKDFFTQKKPVAAICHGPWMLAEAGVLNGRKVTSFKSIRTDLQNAGAQWVDEEVVVDEGLVTSRSPKDLPAFNAKLIEEVREGKHAEQSV